MPGWAAGSRPAAEHQFVSGDGASWGEAPSCAWNLVQYVLTCFCFSFSLVSFVEFDFSEPPGICTDGLVDPRVRNYSVGQVTSPWSGTDPPLRDAGAPPLRDGRVWMGGLASR